ncbi:MAG: hypothetical protein ABL962_11005 [Fimbriimonadaceae bacterium]
MPESTPAPSRKRRRWLLALLPLVLLGFGWWWSTRPPPLPEFLEQFADRTLFRGQFRQDSYTTKPPSTIQENHSVTELFIDATPETVMRAMLDQYGSDEIGLIGGGAMYSHPSHGDPDAIVLMGALFRGRKGTNVVIARLCQVTRADQHIGRIWPAWMDIRFGRKFTRSRLGEVIEPDPAFREDVLKVMISGDVPKAKAKK